MRAVALIVPLLIFLCIFFFYPVVAMLYRSIDNPEVRKGLPRTVEAVRTWDGDGQPDEAVYAALVQDLRAPGERELLGRAARRLNYEVDGFRSLLFETARTLRRDGTAPFKELLITRDSRWGDPSYWAAIRRNAAPVTDHYLLAALDRERDAIDAIAHVPVGEAIFKEVYGRTFWVSAQVTLFCLVIAYPFAFFGAAGFSVSNVFMFFVLLPFWTALLARTTAWIVLLQREGLVNDTLRFLRVIDQPVALVFNRSGVLIAMTHVLLPFAILPLYSVMRNINPIYMRAAQSLGARPAVAFWRIYWPLTLPGVAAGGLLVFILALGYYVTPALVGGSRDQLIRPFIALYTDTYLNWGQASGARGRAASRCCCALPYLLQADRRSANSVEMTACPSASTQLSASVSGIIPYNSLPHWFVYSLFCQS